MSQHDFKKQSNEAPTGNTTHRGTHPSARGNNNQRSHLTRNALLNGSSERSTKVTEAFNKFLKILPQVKESGLDISVVMFDKNSIGTTYDTVALHAKAVINAGGTNKTINMIVPAIIEDMSETQTPRTVVQELDIFFDKSREMYTTSRRGDSKTVYLPTENIDDSLSTSLIVGLGLDNDSELLQMLDGVIIYNYADLDEERILAEYMARCLDVILGNWKKIVDDKVIDIDTMMKNNIVKTTLFTYSEPTENVFGMVLNDNFTMQVSLRQKTDNDIKRGANDRGITTDLLEVKGCVGLRTGGMYEQVNGRETAVPKLVPVVTILDVSTSYLLEDGLLSINAASVLGTGEHAIDILVDTATETNDPGKTLLAIGKPEKTFMKKGVPRSAKEDLLFDNKVEGTRVSIALEKYSMMSGAFSTFQQAAGGSKEALKEILLTLAKMCAGSETVVKDIMSFPIDDILISKQVPGGYFTNGSDKKKYSLNSITLDYICSTHPKYVVPFVESWVSGDVFTERVGIMNDIGLSNATLTGLVEVIDFTTNFLSLLADSLAAVGFVVELEEAKSHKKTDRRGFNVSDTKRFASARRETHTGNKGRERGRRQDGFINKRY